MDFKLSEDHQMLADSLRRYLADNYDFETRNKYAYSDPWQVPELWSGLAELGVIGAFVTEDQGGFGGSAEDVAVIFEEIGRGLCVEPLLGTLLSIRLLAALGREDLVEQIVAGAIRPALAVYEPQVACDLSHLQATARETGDAWHLTGRKSAIYGAAGTDVILVAASTDEGIGLFLAEKPELIAATMVDGGNTADLVMDDLPAECLSTDCRRELEDALDLGRIALCAEAVGAMSHLIDLTVDYMKQRQQFGKPLASFQALQHRVVDMLVELDQCRSITIAATDGFGTVDQARRVSQAKNLIGRMGRKVSEEAIQLHGGIGMTWEYPGAHYAKRLVMIDHQLGDHVDHVQRLVAMSQAATKAA